MTPLDNLDNKGAFDKIIEASKTQKTIAGFRENLIHILSSTDPKQYEGLLNDIISEYGNNKSINLQFASAYIDGYMENFIKKTKEIEGDIISAGKVIFVRERDLSGENKVYKYKVAKGAYPRHIRKEFIRQIGGSNDNIKITNEKGIPYPEERFFAKGDIVYIKAPIESGKVIFVRERDLSGENKVYKYKVAKGAYPRHIRKEFIRQIGGSNDNIKITNEKGIPYSEERFFAKGDIVYIKVPIDTNFEGIDKDIKEKIKIQEDYISLQSDNQKEILKNFNKKYPMGKNVEFSFGIPVKEYEDIDKTLESITTKQTLDPSKYEIVLLLNRPNTKIDFDKTTKDKIIKFKKAHPEYNIVIFEHTFNFKDKAKMGEIYKLLGDTIIYRNIQRKNIKGMDMNKIRNLIIKTGGADSTDKNPNYLQNQLEKYSKRYNGKELVRLTGESRIPSELAKAYPLIEIDEFFQRYYDLEYVGGDPLKRDVGIGSYKAWAYTSVKGFNGDAYIQEDTNFVKRIKKMVNENNDKICMHHDKNFVGAVDNSTDRGICAIIGGIPYCRRYKAAFKGNDETKHIEWNKRALQHKGKQETKKLELTTDNLGRDLSAFYNQRFEKLYKNPAYSTKYIEYLSTSEGKVANDDDKKERLLKNIVNPIMEKVLSKPDFMGLDRGDYKLMLDNKGNPKIEFYKSAILKIKAVQQKKINSGYYDYRK